MTHTTAPTTFKRAHTSAISGIFWNGWRLPRTMNLMSFLYQLESCTLSWEVGVIEQAPILSRDDYVSTLKNEFNIGL